MPLAEQFICHSFFNKIIHLLLRNATPDILVTGGTGFIGSYLLRYLVQNGYTRIRALRRPNSKMDMVAEIQDKIEWVECDLLDVLGLEEAMEGIRYVYHCAALVSMNRRDAGRLIEVNREGTANMVNWSLEKGVEKFLHVSSIAAIGHNKHTEFIDESCHWERSGKLSYYALSKYQAEQEVWRGVAEGLNAVVVNPSVVLGSGRWKEGPLKLFKTALWQNPFYVKGVNGFVDVRDVARFMVAIMESEVSQERFILSSGNYAFKEVQTMMAQSLGKRAPWLAAPTAGMHMAALFGNLLAAITRSEPLLTPEVVRHSTSISRFSNKKSLEVVSSFTYTPLQETIAEVCQQLQEVSKNGFDTRYLPFQ